MSATATERWSPELVRVLKAAAVEAGFESGPCTIQSLGDDQFSIARLSGLRRICVGIEHDAADGPSLRYWREVSPERQVWRQLLSAASGREVQDFRFPVKERLADGTLGYYVRAPRTDDCFAAAIATTLQIPLDDVPDPRIDERLGAGDTADEITRTAQAELTRWLARRGLRMVVHSKPPTDRARWIGVVQMGGAFNDHSLVMSRTDVLFDPTGFHWPGLPPVQQCGLEHVAFGLSFQPTQAKTKRSA